MDELADTLISAYDREIAQLNLAARPSESHLRTYVRRTSEILQRCVRERRRLTDAELVHIRSLDRTLLPGGIASSNLIRLHQIAPGIVQRFAMRDVDAVPTKQVAASVRDIGAVFLAITSQIRASVFADRLPGRDGAAGPPDDTPLAKLLGGRADIEGSDREDLRAVGFVPARSYVIACVAGRAHPLGAEVVARLVRLVSDALSARGSKERYRPIVDKVDGRVAAIVPSTSAPSGPVVDGIRSAIVGAEREVSPLFGAVWGPVTSVEAIAVGYRRTLAVIDVMQELDMENEVMTTERSLSYLLLRSDPELASDLASIMDRLTPDANAKDLMATVVAYQRSSCNVVAAAEELHVHRHTIYARMKRLEELTGYSLEDPNGRRVLGLSIAAKELLDRTVLS